MERVYLHREDLQETTQVTKGASTVDLKRTSTQTSLTHKLAPSRNLLMFFGWAAAGAAIVSLLWLVKPDRKADDVSLMAPEATETVQVTKEAGLQPDIAKVELPIERNSHSVTTEPAETVQTREDGGLQPYIDEEELPSERSVDSMAPEPVDTVLTTEDAELQPDIADEDVPDKYSAQAEMNAERLTDSITYLESKLTSAEVITDSVIAAEQALSPSTSTKSPVVSEATEDLELLPPSFAADDTGSETPVTSIDAETKANGASTNDTPLPAVSSKAADMDRQEFVVNEQPAVSMNTEGPWVINLVSSSSQADADRMAEKARSVGIQTQQQQVTVKGKHYWRVQITGFATKEQASAYGDTAIAKLGLNDVWVMSR